MDQNYFKPIRDARNIPPTQRGGVVSGVPVPAYNDVQQVGGMIFFPDGDARLGEHFIAYGVGVDGLVFAGEYTAYRRLDEPAFLYVHEPQAACCRTFEYRWMERLWYEHVLAKNPEFANRVERHGPALGRLSYKLLLGRRMLGFWFAEGVGNSIGAALFFGGILCGNWLLSLLAPLIERLLTWF